MKLNMTESMAGGGRKRPQINIPLDRIDLDKENPRLAEDYKKATQLDLLKVLYEDFNLDEIGFSMSENGYFDEEPIVVIPKNLPKEFNISIYKDVNKSQIELEKLIKQTDIRFIVVEGNRRIATAKLLINVESREALKIKPHLFPVPKDDFVKEDLRTIPAIVYHDRTNVSAYLGVRHIIGLLKWEAYAKALFLSKRIESVIAVDKNKDIDKAIEVIQKQTGDRSDVIRKQYLYYKLFKEAENDLKINTDNIKDRFSLLTVAMNSPSIREYVGAPGYKEANFSGRLIPIKKIDKYNNLLTWIFGDGKGRESIINDSRKITSHLARILAHEEATEHLESSSNLDDAYDLSDGERDFFFKKLNDANKALKKALGLGWKFKSVEVKESVIELEKLVIELKKMVSK